MEGRASEGTEQKTVMIDVEPSDYRDAAAALPAPLTQALARDVDLTGAEWLAQSSGTASGGSSRT